MESRTGQFAILKEAVRRGDVAEGDFRWSLQLVALAVVVFVLALCARSSVG